MLIINSTENSKQQAHGTTVVHLVLIYISVKTTITKGVVHQRWLYGDYRFQNNITIRKEGSVLFNDALNAFYLRLYGIRHMVKDHSDSEKGNPLPLYRLFFPISSKGSFICTIPQTG